MLFGETRAKLPRSRGFIDDAADFLVDTMQLCDEFSRESPVIVADQGDVTPEIGVGGAETCQLALLSARLAPECISFGDKALDCVCYGEYQALNVLVGGPQKIRA